MSLLSISSETNRVRKIISYEFTHVWIRYPDGCPDYVMKYVKQILNNFFNTNKYRVAYIIL